MDSNSENTPTSPPRTSIGKSLLLGALLGLLLTAVVALAAGLTWLQNNRPDHPQAAPTAPLLTVTPTASTLRAPTGPAAPLGGVGEATPTAPPSATPTPRPTATHFPTHTVTFTPRPVSTYTVQAGETLSAIAFRLGLSLANLAGYNNIPDPALIHVGQVLQVPPGGYTSPPLATPSGPKQIIVSLSQQRVFAYQGDRQVFNFLASTGKDNSTWTGSFTVLDKLPYPYSTAWNFYMPFWLGLYYNPANGNVENGFHALPITPAGDQLWGDDLGAPVSFGCIVLAPYDAKVLYDWVEIGTPVLIYP